mmetsp:Transcript_91540/g.232920  ORF Transcript_91540/g.232920 Transcript_91540/m.232920 type:complete len:305 (-) Transcript_91540:1406-2320(-)
MNLTARTSRVCPMRCARWMACISQAGFHHGSRRKTWLATCKFRPSPPALSEIRMILREVSVLKAVSESARACMVMPPRSTTQARPARFSRNSTNSSIAPNWEKTMHLLVTWPCIIFWISSSTASILVLLWNSDALIFCKMVLLPMPDSAAAVLEGPPELAAPNAFGAGSAARGTPCLPERRRLLHSSIAGCGAGGGGTGDVLAGVSQSALAPRLAEAAAAGEEDDEAAAPFLRGGGVLATAPAALRLVPAAALALALAFFLPPPAPPSSSSSSSSSASSRSMTSFVKHVGQPTPPEARAGASAT